MSDSQGEPDQGAEPARTVVLVGSDHAGLAMKYELVRAMLDWGWQVEDVGPCALGAGGSGLTYDAANGTLVAVTSVDYPDYAFAVARRVAAEEAALGVLICGSGIGMSIAANKVAGVRAALCHEPYSAQMARAHNDANVLCLGGRVIGPEVGKAVVKAFLEGRFEGGRHARRVDLIRAVEEGGGR